MGDLLRLSPWSGGLGPFCVENAIWLLRFWYGRVLIVRRKIGAATCTLYFPFFPDNSEIPATP